MSKYTKEEQTNIVGIAAELETAIIAENDELARLKAQDFRQLPAAPVPVSVPEPQYVNYVVPRMNAMRFFDWASAKTGIPKTVVWLIVLMAQFLFFLVTWFSVYYTFIDSPNITALLISFGIVTIFSLLVAVFALIALLTLKKKHNLYVEQIKNSPEYMNACYAASQSTELQNQQIKANYEYKCRTVREEYDAAMKNYKNVVVPNYKYELMRWKKQQEEKIALVQKDLNENIEALEILYTTTQLIPSSYHTVDRLTWLYEDMSTSEHDIERAIDLLNNKEVKDELFKIQMHIDDLRQDMRDGFMGVYSAIQDGNEIQSAMLEDLEKVRRSAKTGNFLGVVGIIQNHKRNKMISQIQNNM